MSPLWKIYLGVLLVTTAEGGMNIIYPPFLQKSNYSIVEIGLLVALFGVLQLVSRLPVGALYGAAHAKSLYVASLAVYALSTIGFAYPGGRAFVYLLTMLHGFAFGGVGTVTLAWAIELSRAHSPRGAAMGWYTAALSGGYSIGNFLSGLMVDHWGYVVAFLALGVTPIVSVLLTMTLPAPERSASPARAKPDARTRLTQMRRVVTPNVALATLIAFYINFLDDGFFAFFPLFGISIGLGLTFVGLLKSIRSLVATGLRPMSGAIFRYIRFETLNNILIIAWALVVFLVPIFHSAWALVLIFLVIGVSRGLTRVTSATMIAEEKAADTSGVGLASGLYNAGLDVGAFAGPIIGGLIASATTIPTMFSIIPIALLAVYFAAVFGIGRIKTQSPAKSAA
ncbi:MAG TPA: MFS transporter [Anaerolineae bacterium]